MIADKKLEAVSRSPKSRILYSLLIILGLVGIVPLALNSWQLISRYSEEQESAVRELQNETLTSVAEMTYDYLHHYRTKLEDMAQSYAMMQSLAPNENIIDTPENEANLRAHIASDRNIIRLGSYKIGGGEEKALAQQDLADPNIERLINEGAEQAQRGVFVMSAPYYHKFSGDMILVMTAPIVTSVNGNRIVIGLVSAVISLSELQTKLTEDVKGGLTLFVLDDADRLVAHTDRSRLSNPDELQTHPLARELEKQGRIASVTTTYAMVEHGKATDYIGTARSVPGNSKWAVFGQIDKDLAFASVREHAKRSVLAVLAVLAIVIVTGVFFGLSISRPIALLAEGSLRLARGDYAEKIEFPSNNELGQLAATFNYMSQEIQERERKLKNAAEENQQLFLGTIRTLAAAIDAKDPYTRGHSERVTSYTVAIAEEMGLPQEEVDKLRISALLHDVGKIGIDDSILRKPGALTDDEYEIMKGHPQKGAEIMAPIKQMKEFIGGIRFHHETLAGTGYPLGLKGEQIPMSARIIQVADTFDAMTTDRPYQKAMELAAALDRIQSFVGKRYDQSVVDALKSAVGSGKIQPGTVKRRSIEV